ncbi:hypothetical protein EVAR_68873_1 [Eumeta japonica]|uniref:Uncharacterized protein n=1 Tax=Eumeta variegata TaxID=151549 RepID=A0A4C2AB65_EUMVA|nr:hypothetical protein EVAR_68873_1 [Eumeta japonica]
MIQFGVIFITTIVLLHDTGSAVKTCEDSEAESFDFPDILGSWFAFGVAYEEKGETANSPKVKKSNPEEDICVVMELLKTDEDRLKRKTVNFYAHLSSSVFNNSITTQISSSGSDFYTLGEFAASPFSSYATPNANQLPKMSGKSKDSASESSQVFTALHR